MMSQLGYGYTRVEGIKSLYLHFNMLWKHVDKITEETNFVLTNTEYTKIIQNDTLAIDYIRFINPLDYNYDPVFKCPIFYKLSESKHEVKLLKDYNLYHFQNTLIKELLCAGDKGHSKFAKWVVYQLYYYRLFKSDTFETVSTAVLDDLGDIIGLIVRKEFTKYKEFNTRSAVDQLRMAYRTEKMVQLGIAPTNINFRRKR